MDLSKGIMLTDFPILLKSIIRFRKLTDFNWFELIWFDLIWLIDLIWFDWF